MSQRALENDKSDSNDDVSGKVASRTRSRLRVKAREERARLDKARKRLQNISSRNLESVESSPNSPTY